MPQPSRRSAWPGATLCRLWLATGIVAAAAEPVSFNRQIAPVLAMNCLSCHGANPQSVAGGLSTRTWADLKKGGNLGPVIVPGNPGHSALFQFINGARGEAHRMPLGGPPLTAAETALFQRWIEEGAVEDAGTARTYHLQIPSVGVDSVKPVRFFCRLPTTGYVELEIADASGRILYVDGGAIKRARDVTAIALPDEWVAWNLRRASDWPAYVRARLTVSHSSGEPVNAVFAATPATRSSSPEFPAGEVILRAVSSPDDRVALERSEYFPGGVPDPREWQSRFDPGLYSLNLSYKDASRELALLFRVAGKAR